jgi:hypothetical protein
VTEARVKDYVETCAGLIGAWFMKVVVKAGTGGTGGKAGGGGRGGAVGQQRSLPIQAHGTEEKKMEIIKEISLERLEAIIAGSTPLGTERSDSPEPCLRLTGLGMDARFIPERGGRYVRFLFTTKDTDISDEAMDGWNSKIPFATCFAGPGLTRHMASDLCLDGGVTEARVKDFAETCAVLIAAWFMKVVVKAGTGGTGGKAGGGGCGGAPDSGGAGGKASRNRKPARSRRASGGK